MRHSVLVLAALNQVGSTFAATTKSPVCQPTTTVYVRDGTIVENYDKGFNYGAFPTSKAAGNPGNAIASLVDGYFDYGPSLSANADYGPAIDAGDASTYVVPASVTYCSESTIITCPNGALITVTAAGPVTIPAYTATAIGYDPYYPAPASAGASVPYYAPPSSGAAGSYYTSGYQSSSSSSTTSSSAPSTSASTAPGFVIAVNSGSGSTRRFAKRTLLGYLETTTGSVVPKAQAEIFHLDNGRLRTHGGLFVGLGSGFSSAFFTASLTEPNLDVTWIAGLNKTVSFSNPAFAGGFATFCEDANNKVRIVATSAPQGCLTISLTIELPLSVSSSSSFAPTISSTSLGTFVNSSSSAFVPSVSASSSGSPFSNSTTSAFLPSFSATSSGAPFANSSSSTINV